MRVERAGVDVMFEPSASSVCKNELLGQTLWPLIRGRTASLIAAPLKNLSANLDNTLIPNSQIARGPEREVEDAATNVWSTVRNANNH
jgi:hypothetical protein